VGEGQDDRLPALAAEVVALKPDVIVTIGTPGRRLIEIRGCEYLERKAGAISDLS
jgi:hypothetical protein